MNLETGRSYRITHRTDYRYSDVVTSSYGRGFLAPRDSARQRCLTYQLDIDPQPADQSTSLDAYGNISSYFHITNRHRELTVTSTSVVEVDPPPADLYGTGPAVALSEMPMRSPMTSTNDSHTASSSGRSRRRGDGRP